MDPEPKTPDWSPAETLFGSSIFARSVHHQSERLLAAPARGRGGLPPMGMAASFYPCGRLRADQEHPRFRSHGNFPCVLGLLLRH
ncbi:hypothetical protein N7468_000254 [Penicillium chermesinum]|uniref:Uncharacterized protein n=1 Tax=Penicillium chermesinum TaxID=63820 RepID=A0A9W9PJW5_9EURO|nr:uncharacterized protein N7468_000254 [Penicillium chermesinum]KAJ5248803.1 hypothetical protein N7468_000254 [Penicillium chermesinum]